MTPVRRANAETPDRGRASAAITLADLPLRADLRGAVAYGAPSVDVPVRLNTNENTHPLPAALVADLADALGAVAAGLNRYPDRDAVALRADLASYLRGRPGGAGIGPERVWAANGSNEILTQLLQAFGGPGRRALGFTPTYSMYPHLCATTGTEWVDGRVGDPLTPELVATRIREAGPDLVFLCSPNNPTGAALPAGVAEAATASAAGMVVVDEAYAEFARPGATAALGLLDGRPNLVVTRTMSKAFGMAGLRLGYLAADPAVVRALLLVRLPYHLSALTQAAARVALAHAPALLDTVEAIIAQRDRITRSLPGMGLVGADSDANFVLVGRFADSGAAWRALLDRGVAVRDVGLPGRLRVTAGTPAEVDAFLAALAAVAPEHRVREGVSAAEPATDRVSAAADQ